MKPLSYANETNKLNNDSSTGSLYLSTNNFFQTSLLTGILHTQSRVEPLTMSKKLYRNFVKTGSKIYFAVDLKTGLSKPDKWNLKFLRTHQA